MIAFTPRGRGEGSIQQVVDCDPSYSLLRQASYTIALATDNSSSSSTDDSASTEYSTASKDITSSNDTTAMLTPQTASADPLLDQEICLSRLHGVWSTDKLDPQGRSTDTCTIANNSTAKVNPEEVLTVPAV